MGFRVWGLGLREVYALASPLPLGELGPALSFKVRRIAWEAVLLWLLKGLPV